MKTRHENYEALGKNMKVLMDNMKAATPDMAAVSVAAAKVKKTADVDGHMVPGRHRPGNRHRDRSQGQHLDRPRHLRRSCREAADGSNRSSPA